MSGTRGVDKRGIAGACQGSEQGELIEHMHLRFHNSKKTVCSLACVDKSVDTNVM